VRREVSYARHGNSLWLDDGSGHFFISNETHLPASALAAAGSGEVLASMDGAIVDVMVVAGDVVTAGQTLVVLEAMKMEHPLKATIDGAVSAVNTQVGDQVKSKQLLVSIAEQESVA